jgi:hypothetical protein
MVNMHAAQDAFLHPACAEGCMHLHHCVVLTAL